MLYEVITDKKMEIEFIHTICPYCGTGCGVDLVVKDRITSYNVCYTKLLRGARKVRYSEYGCKGQKPPQSNSF